MQRNEAFQKLVPEIQRVKTYEELMPLIEERIRFGTFQDIQKNLKERQEKKDLLENLLKAQMNLIPIISDLTRDYSVKGHYAMRGKAQFENVDKYFERIEVEESD